MTKEYVELILKSVRTENGCLEYAGVKNHQKYGVLMVKKTIEENGIKKIKTVPMIASRASWYFNNGDIPKGMFVCHKCDNPPCINIKHLFLGTPRDNTLDAIKKGRLNPSRGKTHRDDLNKYQIFDIINTRLKPKLLMKKYNITQPTISIIRKTDKYIKMSEDVKNRYKIAKDKGLSLIIDSINKKVSGK